MATIKSHGAADEINAMLKRNKGLGIWVYCKDAVDVAVDVEANPQGKHKATLKKGELSKASLWKILCRLFAVDEEDIRGKDAGAPMLGEDIIVAAESQVVERERQPTRSRKEGSTS